MQVGMYVCEHFDNGYLRVTHIPLNIEIITLMVESVKFSFFFQFQ